ncbi:post-transcriptional regulator [Halobacillus litoralis]|uniref:post-transcriptional regulator n=1 Tax=Halobacillus litoralis TaxID=45668 RepID=UPI001CD57272|nr:post-transcriptional regulator [Halobacillus litoralis]MCA0969966.1 post-transcriptional regulator [Halobacillus litoralis]
MYESKSVHKWKKQIDPVLTSKVEELRMMGYERVTKEEVWHCLVKKVWKGEPEKRLYEMVQDVFHLSSHTYVSYLAAEAYQDEDLLASIEAVTHHQEGT